MLNKEKGITTVNITHYMDEAARADRIIVFNRGSVILDGTPGEVFAQPELLRAAGLDLPQCIDLAHRLKKNGIKLSGNCSTPDSCADAVVRAYNEHIK